MARSVLCLMLTVLLVGCGGSNQDIPLSVSSGQPSSTTDPAAAPSNVTAQIVPKIQHVLVGNWKGLLLATPQQLAAMNCLSVSLELEFGDNGEMAMLAVMKKNEADAGEESAGIATWSIIAEEGNKYTIRSQEAGGESQELDIVMPDNNTIVVSASDGGQFQLTRQ